MVNDAVRLTGPPAVLLVAVSLLLTARQNEGAEWPQRHLGLWREIKDTPEQAKLRCELKGKGRICFATNRDGNREIYVTDPDGSNQVNLTNNPAWDLALRWSADGRKIVFYSDRDSDWKLRD